MASAPFLGRTIAAYGFEYVAVGHDLPEAVTTDPIANEVAALTGRRALSVAKSLHDFAQWWEPDVVLRDSVEFGSYAVAERLSIPHVSAPWCGHTTLRSRSTALYSGIEAIRAAVGLPKPFDWSGLFRFHHFEAMPQSFFPKSELLPTTTRYIGQKNPVGPGETECDWFSDLPFPRSVLITFGTVTTPIKLLLRLYRALRGFQCNLIFSVGGAAAQMSDRRVPSNVVFRQSVPQSWLIPRCEFVICHGGINTVRESIRENVPLLLAPQFNDQFFVAKRCSELGIGITLPESVQVREIRDLFEHHRRDSTLSESVNSFREEMLSLDGPTSVAEIIEETRR